MAVPDCVDSDDPLEGDPSSNLQPSLVLLRHVFGPEILVRTVLFEHAAVVAAPGVEPPEVVFRVQAIKSSVNKASQPLRSGVSHAGRSWTMTNSRPGFWSVPWRTSIQPFGGSPSFGFLWVASVGRISKEQVRPIVLRTLVLLSTLRSCFFSVTPERMVAARDRRCAWMEMPK